MRASLKYLIISLMFITNPVIAQDRAVDDIDGSSQFIQTLGNQTIGILGDTTLNSDDRYSSFRTLFAEATDINTLTRMLLGRHYRTVVKQGHLEAYKKSVEDYIISEFEEQIQLIGFDSVEVIGTRPAKGKRGELIVRTDIKVIEGDDFQADWRVQKKKGKFSIINVTVLGYNFAVSGRQLFQSRIKELGIPGHIAELEKEYARSTSENKSLGN